MSLRIGPIKLRNSVFLAPMAGITDLPFRQLAHDFGAGLVVSEMVATRELLTGRAETALRAESSDSITPFAIQLAGREPEWMAEGARVAEAGGADIIDINMGCPAKKVTSGYSGSALMKDLDLAAANIDAVVKAVKVPVSLKMRLGWDDDLLNAPQLARRAEELGVQMITVHGRTRCQFYKGKANWSGVAEVVDAVSVPVIVNGDITNADSAAAALKSSGAAGVMVGRGARGRPWVPGHIAQYLESGQMPEAPSGNQLKEIVLQNYQGILDIYGDELGLRIARKHLGWYAEGFVDAAWFWSKVCRETDIAKVIGVIENFFDESFEHGKERAA
ncbi:MAG: tRNA dihydrouridine synthase DusB [Alphaproteobacteria bacterium]|nr:MAG: tRNA dihydrouridine synthase DusB [Alphaproteobacteria bacterium]